MTSPNGLLRRRSIPAPLRWVGLAFAWLFAAPAVHLAGLVLGWQRVLPRLVPPFGDFGDYRATEHDVFAAVYFKSGTNWLMQIALQIAHRGAADFDHVHDVVAWPDVQHPRFAVPLDDPGPQQTSPTGLRIIKTHATVDHVPRSPDARYLCVLRDPKDVFVSSYHFVRAVALGPMMPPISAWLDWFLSEDFPWGDWAEHSAGWWARRGDDSVHVVRFDDLKADLPGCVSAIAEAMGVALTEAQAAAVVERASFEHMRRREPAFAPGMLVPWARPRGAMMRRGASGGSDELLSEAQQRRIDDHMKAALARLGSDLPYDAFFGD